MRKINKIHMKLFLKKKLCVNYFLEIFPKLILSCNHADKKNEVLLGLTFV
jgi:hypothetical protein